MLGVVALFLQVQMGTVVRPETVTVGQHFTATVRIRVANGVQLRVPAAPDTSARVDTARAAERHSTAGPEFTETTISYVLAAWDTGVQKLGLGGIGMSSAGRERLVPLADLSVYVKSVLPPDTALRKPKPPRPAVSVSVFNWLVWAIAAGIGLLLGLLGLLTWLWRRRRRSTLDQPEPFAWAEREFAQVESSGWLDGGEPERYAMAMAEIMRRYVSLIDPDVASSLTTREIAAVIHGSAMLPVERVVRVLERVDPLKFAAGRVGREEAARIGGESRLLVADIHQRTTEAQLAATRAADPARAAA